MAKTSIGCILLSLACISVVVDATTARFGGDSRCDRWVGNNIYDGRCKHWWSARKNQVNKGLPVVDNVKPNVGSLAGGQLVTIQGANLKPVGGDLFAEAVKVMFGGVTGELLAPLNKFPPRPQNNNRTPRGEIFFAMVSRCFSPLRLHLHHVPLANVRRDHVLHSRTHGRVLSTVRFVWPV